MNNCVGRDEKTSSVNDLCRALGGILSGDRMIVGRRLGSDVFGRGGRGGGVLGCGIWGGLGGMVEEDDDEAKDEDEDEDGCFDRFSGGCSPLDRACTLDNKDIERLGDQPSAALRWSGQSCVDSIDPSTYLWMYTRLLPYLTKTSPGDKSRRLINFRWYGEQRPCLVHVQRLCRKSVAVSRQDETRAVVQ